MNDLTSSTALTATRIISATSRTTLQSSLLNTVLHFRLNAAQTTFFGTKSHIYTVVTSKFFLVSTFVTLKTALAHAANIFDACKI